MNGFGENHGTRFLSRICSEHEFTLVSSIAGTIRYVFVRAKDEVLC